jgi:hypothetical protein
MERVPTGRKSMATEWIVMTEEDLNDFLVGAQVNALRTAALATGQSDPFENIMPAIAQRIRLKIASCTRNRLSATPDSIPPELKWIAAYLIIEAMQGRIPSLRLSDDQKSQVSEARKQLDRIADCKDVVSEPVDPEESVAQQSGGISLVSSTERAATRTKMNGL